MGTIYIVNVHAVHASITSNQGNPLANLEGTTYCVTFVNLVGDDHVVQRFCSSFITEQCLRLQLNPASFMWSMLQLQASCRFDFESWTCFMYMYKCM